MKVGVLLKHIFNLIDSEMDLNHTYLYFNDSPVYMFRNDKDMIVLHNNMGSIKDCMTLRTLIECFMDCYCLENFQNAKVVTAYGPAEYTSDLTKYKLKEIKQLPETMKFWSFIEQINGELVISPADHKFSIILLNWSFENNSKIISVGNTVNETLRILSKLLQKHEITNSISGEIISVPKRLTLV